MEEARSKANGLRMLRKCARALDLHAQCTNRARFQLWILHTHMYTRNVFSESVIFACTES